MTKKRKPTGAAADTTRTEDAQAREDAAAAMRAIVVLEERMTQLEAKLSAMNHGAQWVKGE